MAPKSLGQQPGNSSSSRITALKIPHFGTRMLGFRTPEGVSGIYLRSQKVGSMMSASRVDADSIIQVGHLTVRLDYGSLHIADW